MVAERNEVVVSGKEAAVGVTVIIAPGSNPEININDVEEIVVVKVEVGIMLVMPIVGSDVAVTEIIP